MGIKHRSFSGKLFRPKPYVEEESDGSFLAIATPWGDRSGTEQSVNILRDFVVSSQEDMEATSPFAKVSCLSPLGNNLRAAIRLMNDTLYNDDNQNEYRAGAELFALARSGQEIVWAQVGLPHVLLDREGYPLIPLGNSPDLSLELGQITGYSAPLPMNLLGLAGQSNFAVHSLRPQIGDQLIFISRSYIPTAVLNLPRADRKLEIISDQMATVDAEAPFWVATFKL